MAAHRTPHRPGRPLLGAVCALAALTVALTACTTPLGTPTAQQAAQLRIWYGTDDPTESAWAQTLARRFHSAHPATRVTLTTYSLDDLNTKMQLALHAGNTPDLVYTTPRGPGLPAYVRAGELRDLSSDARRLGWASQQRPGLLATYNDTLAPNGRAGGHVYGVPYVMAGVAVLYNKAIFRRLHLAVPRTLAAFEQASAQAKRAGLTPLGLGNADGWLGDDWWLTLVNATVGPAALASELRLDPAFSFEAPPFRAAAATLQQWSTKGYFTPNFGGLDAQDSMETFFQGHTAMQLVSSTENSQILSLAHGTGLHVGIFPFPSATAGRAPVIPVSGYEGWAVPRAAREPQAAVAFVDQMVSASTAQVLVAQGMLPSHRFDRSTMHPASPFQREYLDALDHATPGVYLDSAPVPNLNATMEANIQLLLQNDETPGFLTRSLQQVYASRGKQASSTRTDGEF